MNCDNEVAREMAAGMIQQVTPFYIMASIAIVSLAIVVVGGFRGKVATTPAIRWIVTMALAVAVIFTLYRFAYDRAFIRAWTEKACVAPASGNR